MSQPINTSANALSVLVVGATGNIGTPTVKFLSEFLLNGKITAMTRPGTSDAATKTFAECKNVTIVECDLSDRDQVFKTVEGHDRVVLITRATPDQLTWETNVVDAAIQHHTKYLIKIAAYGKVCHENSPILSFRSHHAIAQKLSKSSIPYTIVRPAFFFGNLMMLTAPSIPHGQVSLPWCSDLKMPWIDGRDAGEVVAKLVSCPDVAKYVGQELELVGPQYSIGEVVQAQAVGMGKQADSIKYNQVSYEQWEQGLKQYGVNDFLASMAAGILRENEINASFLTSIQPGLIKLITGHEPRDLPNFLKAFGLADQQSRLEAWNRTC